MKTTKTEKLNNSKTTQSRKGQVQRDWGIIRLCQSGRYQASFIGPDGKRYRGPVTFESKMNAEAWLYSQRRDIEYGMWKDPRITYREDCIKSITLNEYAPKWLKERRNSYGEPLRFATVYKYERTLKNYILPQLGDVCLVNLTAAKVRQWYDSLNYKMPQARSDAYRVLKAICATACELDDDGVSIIAINPCRIKGAGSYKHVHKCYTASPAEIVKLANAMPKRYQLAVYLAAYCGLRRGEIMGLRRQDLNLKLMVVQVRRQLRKVGGTYSVSPPKNREGSNDVTIPEALREVCEHHLKFYAAKRPEGYLFTRQTSEKHLSETSLYQYWVNARKAVNRSDLRFHDLRKTCATMVAEAGGTIADVMERLRDKTPEIAITYIQQAQNKQRQVADMFSQKMLQGLDEVMNE